MLRAMRTYLDLLQHILDNGKRRTNRTGTDTIGVFGYQARFDLRTGFPLLTTKKMFIRGIVEELLWFLSGDTNAKTLQDKGVHIWDEWATKEQCAKFDREEGDLGPIYGWTWRHFGGNYDNREAIEKHSIEWPNGFDQLAWLVDEIVKNPNSRRLIVTGWDPREAQCVALPPCHTLFQFYVEDPRASRLEQPKKHYHHDDDIPECEMYEDVEKPREPELDPRPILSCHLYQRSADAFLGVPFNIASYALLTHLIAHVTGLQVGEFVHTFGDLHVYTNHLDQVREQLSRAPYPLPTLRISRTPKPGESPLQQLLSIRFQDIFLEGYTAHPAIKAPVAV